VLKASSSGSVTYLRDVARIELGASEYGLRSLIEESQAGRSVGVPAPGANSLQISDAVHKAMTEIKPDMPEGVEYIIDYDTTQLCV